MNEGELLQRLLPWLTSAFAAGFQLGLGVILFCLLALPLHDFLNASEARIRRRGLYDGSIQFPRLAAAIDDLARRVVKVQLPCLLISPHHSDGAHVLGSFRRRYLVLSEAEARRLEHALDSSLVRQRRAEALLLHELAHFANRDVWTFLPLFYLLRAVTLGLAINLWLVLVRLAVQNRLNQFRKGAIVFAGRDLSKTIPMAVWATDDTLLLFLNALLFVGGLIMLFLIWRAFLRQRELSADARVTAWQGSAQPLGEALLCESVYQTMRPRPCRLREQLFWRWGNIWRLGLPVWKQVRQWLCLHPSLETRCDHLKDSQP
jgi:Peptidase family M48